MEDFKKCEECGGETEFRQEGSVQGVFCKSCDWSVVTTYIPEIELDETKYSIYVIGANYHNEKHIRVVSSISGMNYLKVRNLLQEDKPLIFDGEAIKVRKVKDLLESAGLKYEIFPEYNY